MLPRPVRRKEMSFLLFHALYYRPASVVLSLSLSLSFFIYIQMWRRGVEVGGVNQRCTSRPISQPSSSSSSSSSSTQAAGKPTPAAKRMPSVQLASARMCQAPATNEAIAKRARRKSKRQRWKQKRQRQKARERERGREGERERGRERGREGGREGARERERQRQR